jgi:hypothetical protein
MQRIKRHPQNNPRFEAFFSELNAILKSAGGISSSSWRHIDLQGISSYDELLKILNDQDPNKKIAVADAVGRAGHLLSDEGKKQVISGLCSLLGDIAINDYVYAGFQSDEDCAFFVSATVAEALVRLGYGENVEAVFEKARKAGYEVKECHNIP